MGEGFGYLDERVGGAGRNRDGAMEGFGPKPRLPVRQQPLELSRCFSSGYPPPPRHPTI